MNVILTVAILGATSFVWPEPTRTSRPWIYNWWMGCAVDRSGLEAQADVLKDAGFGGLHVIPIYGVRGNRANEVKYHSPQGEEKLALAKEIAERFDLGMDVSGAPGFTFGDATLTPEEGMWIRAKDGTFVPARKNLKCSGARDRGVTLNPFDPRAMTKFLRCWDAHATLPRAMYHDSYDYHGAAWAPDLPREVTIPALATRQVETFRVWTDWCRAHGVLTRYQAHGSLGDWLELYALADIPEAEVCGSASEKKLLTAKFASSAAHLKGTRLVSCETGTWLANHFHVRLADLKRHCDALFTVGVNHVFFHGLCYSPVHEPWPGWVFYAASQLHPRNPIWRDLPALNAYLTRCQSLLQAATVENDLLLFWPVEDNWAAANGDAFAAEMSVSNAEKWMFANDFGHTARALYARGYGFDYVSTRTRNLPGARGKPVVQPGDSIEALAIRPEPFGKSSGLDGIRLRLGTDYLYFIVNLGNRRREGAYALRALEKGYCDVQHLDAWTGEIQSAAVTSGGVSLALEPGESAFLLCRKGEAQPVRSRLSREVALTLSADGWLREAVAGGPDPLPINAVVRLGDWTTDNPVFSGTMRYSRHFDANETNLAALDLGKVLESARVRLNGRNIGVRIQPPFAFEVPQGLVRAKDNLIEIEVTSLAVNRVRDLDRRKVDWKHFEGNNVYAPNYKPLDASGWSVRPAGLFGPVAFFTTKERKTK